MGQFTKHMQISIHLLYLHLTHKRDSNMNQLEVGLSKRWVYVWFFIKYVRVFFCRKFNPISTRGQSMPTTVLRVPRFSNLATVLYIKVNIYHQWNPKCGYTLFANFWKSWGVTISCRNQSYEIKSPPYYIALFHHTVDGCTMAIKVYILVLSIEK